jgi:hypothetical protein
MKKAILLNLFCVVFIHVQAQYLSVASPSSYNGQYLHTINARWGAPVLGTQVLQGVFANTGTSNPTQACTTLSGNTTDAGKIFFIDRSTACSIDTQFYHAEQAGAAAIVLCDNNGTTSPYPLIAPFVSASVPCMALTETACDSIRLDLQTGNITFRLSDRKDLNSNVSLLDIKVPDNYYTTFCQRRPIDLSCKLRNNGNLAQNNVSVLVTVTGPQGVIFSDNNIIQGTLAPAPQTASTVAANDVLISANASILPTALGLYQVTYTIDMPGIDEDPSDNTFLYQFEITDTQYERTTGTLSPGLDFNTVMGGTDRMYYTAYYFPTSDHISAVRAAAEWSVLTATNEYANAVIFKKGWPWSTQIAFSGPFYPSINTPDDTWVEIPVFDMSSLDYGVNISMGDTILVLLFYEGNQDFRISQVSGPGFIGEPQQTGFGFPVAGYMFNEAPSSLTANNSPMRLALGCVTEQCFPTGTEQFDKQLEFSLYPNPAQDQIKVIAQASTESLQCSIFTALGQQVKAVEITSHGIIDISDLPQGQYYIFCQQGSSFGTKTFSK